MDLGGLDVLGVDAVVADVRIRQRDDLPAVARVGQDFLVAGQRGVEDHLADRVAGRADRDASKTVPSARARRAGGTTGSSTGTRQLNREIVFEAPLRFGLEAM